MKARRVATSRPYRLAAPRRAARRTAHAMVHLAASVEADLDAFVQDLKRRCGPRHCALLLLHPRRAPSRGAAREPDARARALEPSNAHPALGFHARPRSGAARRRRARRGGPCCQQRQPPKGKRTRGAALLGHQREPIDAPTPRNCWPSSTRAAGGVAARAAARSARGSCGRRGRRCRAAHPVCAPCHDSARAWRAEVAQVGTLRQDTALADKNSAVRRRGRGKGCL